MSDFIPQKPSGVKVGGLGPKAQKLQALREKLAQQKSSDKTFAASGNGPKTKASSAPNKKTSFQRKAT